MPKTTTPLTKLILTTEGWLVVAFNAVIALAAIFGSLPGSQALKWGGVVTTATMISRQGLKAIAALSPVFGAPAPTQAMTDAEKFIAEILAQPEIPAAVIANVAAETQAQQPAPVVAPAPAPAPAAPVT